MFMSKIPGKTPVNNEHLTIKNRNVKTGHVKGRT
jgi:hypothetical protein